MDDALQRKDSREAEKLFLQQLGTIERIVAFACRRAAIDGAEAEDFCSIVKLKLIENRYAIIRTFEKRCSFAAYLSVVVQRLLLDYRIALWGKWHASAEARRGGEVAVAVEAMLIRDRLTIEEAMPALVRRWPELRSEHVSAIASSLPPRLCRPRPVDLESTDGLATPFAVHDIAFESERVERSRHLSAIIRAAIAGYDDEHRLLFRLRFEAGMSVAEIGRVLATDSKPLYRRLHRLLLDLRGRLARAGFSASEAEEILDTTAADLDFGFEPEGEEP